MKHLPKILIALFLAICLTPFVGLLLGFESAAGANEILSPAPRFGLTMLNEASDYVADRFALRQQCISLWSLLNEKLLRTSAEEQVVLGRDGFLYYSATLDDYTGVSLSDAELEAIAGRLLALQKALEAEGKRFVFTIAPNKNSLYPEHMPAGIANRHESSSAVRLIPYLERFGVHYADLFTPLSQELLYYRTDSHWTAQGAARGADAILAALGRESAYSAHEFGQEGVHRGDLYEDRGSDRPVLYRAQRGQRRQRHHDPHRERERERLAPLLARLLRHFALPLSRRRFRNRHLLPRGGL